MWWSLNAGEADSRLGDQGIGGMGIPIGAAVPVHRPGRYHSSGHASKLVRSHQQPGPLSDLMCTPDGASGRSAVEESSACSSRRSRRRCPNVLYRSRTSLDQCQVPLLGAWMAITPPLHAIMVQGTPPAVAGTPAGGVGARRAAEAEQTDRPSSALARGASPKRITPPCIGGPGRGQASAGISSHRPAGAVADDRRTARLQHPPRARSGATSVPPAHQQGDDLGAVTDPQPPPTWC